MAKIKRLSGAVLFCEECGRLYLDAVKNSNSSEFFSHKCKCGGTTFNVFSSDKNGRFSSLTGAACRFLTEQRGE